MNNHSLLEISGLKKYFPELGGITGKKVLSEVKALDGVDLTVNYGETLGIVGESGCGKSTMGRTILKLLEPTEGKIIFEGQDITALSQKQMIPYRKDIQMIFQDPFASLNPRMNVFEIIEEPLINFGVKDKKERKTRVFEVAEQVGLSTEQLERLPHEFSGGQRQRIGIARALISKPKLIIADEPVSALDVSIQSQILNLMRDLQKEYNLTYIFISHDLSVVKHFCDRIGVMYLGKLIELSSKDQLYNSSFHPYAKSLLSSLPKSHPDEKKDRIVLSGDVPSPSNPPDGCTFHTRCFACMEVCKTVSPEFEEVAENHFTACHLYTGEVGQENKTHKEVVLNENQ